MSNNAHRRHRKVFSAQDIATFLGHPVPCDRSKQDDTDRVLADIDDSCSTDAEDPVAEPAYLFSPSLRFIPDK